MWRQVEAWTAAEIGKRETAEPTLDCTAYLLSSVRDPLLEWIQDVLQWKLEK